MTKANKFRLAGSLLCLLSMSSCADKYFEDMTFELYTRNFIKEFGLIDPDHDWNMAKQAVVNVNLGDATVGNVKIYGKYGATYYLVADLDNVAGTIKVPVDLPKSCTDIMVKANGRKYYGTLGNTINCAAQSRGVPDNEEYQYTKPNTNPIQYTETKNGYTVIVKNTNRGNGYTTGYESSEGGSYQYFNTQQISPIVSPNLWSPYYSINTGGMSGANSLNTVGLLPERGIYNQPQSTLTNWLDEKAAEEREIVEDFKIGTGEDGSFTMFPFYYGTNLEHEIGVYLLDEDGNPLLANGGTYNTANVNNYTLDDFIHFPVFRDREKGDLQVQPHYDSRIQEIRLKNQNKDGDNWLLDMEKGTPYDLESLVELKLTGYTENDGWIPYAGENGYLQKFGNQYHSRIAYHIWVEEVEWNGTGDKPAKPVVYATCTKNGIVSPLVSTIGLNSGWNRATGLISIATGMENDGVGNRGMGRMTGVATQIAYKITDSGSSGNTGSVRLAVANTGLPDGVTVSMSGATATINMSVGDEFTLPITVTSSDNKTLADIIGAISFTTYENSPFSIWKDGNAIKIKGNQAGEQWGHIKYSEGSYEYDLALHVYITGGSSTTPATDIDHITFTSSRITHSGGVNYRLAMNTNDSETITVTKIYNSDNEELDLDTYFQKLYFTDWLRDNGVTVSRDSTNHTFTIATGDKEFTEAWPKIYTNPGNNNSDWSENNSKVLVDINLSATAPVHTYTITVDADATSNEVPSSISTNWSTYFTTSAGETKTAVWTGSQALAYNSCDFITNDTGDWVAGTKLIFKFTRTENDSYVRLYAGSWDTNLFGETTALPSDATQAEFTLTEEMVTKIKDKGLYAQGNGATLTQLDVVIPSSTQFTGMETALGAIKAHYEKSENNPGTQPCQKDGCSEQVDFSNAEMTYDLGNKCTSTHIHYTVTWTKEISSSTSAPKRNLKAQRTFTTPASGKSAVKSKGAARKAAPARASSRAEGSGKPALLDDNGHWQDVNAYWSRYLPYQEEVASYPSEQTMLARSRGYDVTIKYDADNDGIAEPWVGDLGMYMKVVGSHDLDANGANPTFTQGISNSQSNYNGTKYPYIVYSQSRFNKLPDGHTPSEQISALTVKHPLTGRTFLTFEDMLVLDANINTDMYWLKSSDRDVNDIVLNITNFSAISNDTGKKIEEKEIEDEGFPWIWAVEDLGSVDDFDFNDVVMRVSSVTKTKQTITTETDDDKNETTTTTYSAMYKKVVFTPLAAGGTLPIYIHLKDGREGVNKDYILRPGTFNLTNAEVNGVAAYNNELSDHDTKAEIHRWFGSGNYSYRTMINTGAGTKATGKTCTLYVDAPTLNTATGAVTAEGFAINYFEKDSNGKAKFDVVDNKGLIDAKTIYFYVEVSGSSENAAIDETYANDRTIINTSHGQAPQSFIIFGDGWKWPQERKHILLAYPSFGEWVKDKDKNGWTKSADINADYLY